MKFRVPAFMAMVSLMLSMTIGLSAPAQAAENFLSQSDAAASVLDETARESVAPRSAAAAATSLGIRPAIPAASWDTRLKQYGQTKCLDYWAKRKTVVGPDANQWHFEVRNWCSKSVSFKVKISRASCAYSPRFAISTKGKWEKRSYRTCWNFGGNQKVSFNEQ